MKSVNTDYLKVNPSVDACNWNKQKEQSPLTESMSSTTSYQVEFWNDEKQISEYTTCYSSDPSSQGTALVFLKFFPIMMTKQTT